MQWIRGTILGVLLCVVSLLIVPTAHGQSNDALDIILSEQQLTYGSAALLVLSATGRIDEESSFAQAVSRLDAFGWSIADRAAADPVTLGEYSFLLMRALELPGGLMYRIAPGPRYAAREVAALRIAEGTAMVNMSLSGERALRMLGRAMIHAEGGRL